MDQPTQQPSNVHFHNAHPDLGDSRAEILDGLAQPNKRISLKWFYDAHGSELFEQITQLPEYYPTRTEIGILSDHRSEISAHCGSDCSRSYGRSNSAAAPFQPYSGKGV